MMMHIVVTALMVVTAPLLSVAAASVDAHEVDLVEFGRLKA